MYKSEWVENNLLIRLYMPWNVFIIRSLGSSRSKIKLKYQDLSNCSIYKRQKARLQGQMQTGEKEASQVQRGSAWVSQNEPSPAAGGKGSTVDLAHSALPTILPQVLVPLALHPSILFSLYHPVALLLTTAFSSIPGTCSVVIC